MEQSWAQEIEDVRKILQDKPYLGKLLALNDLAIEKMISGFEKGESAEYLSSWIEVSLDIVRNILRAGMNYDIDLNYKYFWNLLHSEEFHRLFSEWNDSSTIFHKSLQFILHKNEIDLISMLWKGYANKSYQVRKLSTILLIHVLDNQAINVFIDLLHESEDNSSAAWALGEIGDPKAGPILHEMFNEKKWKSYGVALGKIRYIEALPDIFSVMLDDDATVSQKQGVSSALGKYGSDAVPIILASLNNVGKLEKTYLIYSLGEIGDDSAVDTLISTAKEIEDMYFGIRNDYGKKMINTIDAIQKIGSSKAIEVLIDITNNSMDKWISRRALDTILSFDEQREADELVRLMDNRDIEIREKAILALSKIGSPDTIWPLIEVIENNHQTRYSQFVAAKGLLNIGEAAIEKLRTAIFRGIGGNRAERELSDILNEISRELDGSTECLSVENVYNYTNSKGDVYYLHFKDVELRHKKQRLYFFAKDVRDGYLEELPDGYEIVENAETNMPFIKKIDKDK